MKFYRTKPAVNYDYFCGFFWDKKYRRFFIAFWQLVFCFEFPQKEKDTIEFKDGKGNTIYKQKIDRMYLGIALEDKDATQPLKESDLEFTIKPPYHERDHVFSAMMEGSNTCGLCGKSKERHEIQNVVLNPKEDLLRAQHTALCGPIDAHEIHYARKMGFILHGWTGEKCPHCNGCGEVDSGGTDSGGNWINRKCDACSGTGDEYGELKAK